MYEVWARKPDPITGQVKPPERVANDANFRVALKEANTQYRDARPVEVWVYDTDRNEYFDIPENGPPKLRPKKRVPT